MPRASTCGRVEALGPTPSAPKQMKSDVHVKILNFVCARSPVTKFERKTIVESAAIYKRVSVHWLPHCHAIGLCKRTLSWIRHQKTYWFFHLMKHFGQSHRFELMFQKNSIYLANLNRFVACWILIFGLLKSNIEVRQDTPKFLTASQL